MKEIIVNSIEEGQRFDKYLSKYLPNAGARFIYKMLRKKNITLNNGKATGKEKLSKGDVVKIFFSDETFETFSGNKRNSLDNRKESDKKLLADNDMAFKFKNCIEFENEHIIVVNKPAGMLSQKALKSDVSLVEYLTAYINANKNIAGAKGFKPGVCNRLDRNTSGLVVAGKSIRGLQVMTQRFKDRSLNKYYICIVKGKLSERQQVAGYLYKNEKNNKVTIYKKGDKNIPDDALWTETEYIPVAGNESITLLKVHLITGRTHQIRAHMSFIGHPIIGDMKYGKDNEYYKEKYGIINQMLHSYELDMEKEESIGITQHFNVTTKIPKEFIDVLEGEKLWQPGIQEDLEVLH